jgi:hypothetical protein
MKKLVFGQLFQTSRPKKQNDFSIRTRGQNGSSNHVPFPKEQLPERKKDFP